MLVFANALNGAFLDVDLEDVPKALGHELLDFGTGAHHLEKIRVIEEVQAGVLGSDLGQGLINLGLEFENFGLNVTTVDLEGEVLGNVTDRVVEVEALDELAVGLSQFIK